ncbi:hypothetical protein K0M31_007763 [Melipona bicolor]|uniref:Uncharacterized protein n=1 Tax=Melipona bicolor TaxID=60889 RepID=A0AA40GC19_9HYME|nr:hypothetical protein K0M31_007763 [Melipona bicolor]
MMQNRASHLDLHFHNLPDCQDSCWFKPIVAFSALKQVVSYTLLKRSSMCGTQQRQQRPFSLVDVDELATSRDIYRNDTLGGLRGLYLTWRLGLHDVPAYPYATSYELLPVSSGREACVEVYAGCDALFQRRDKGEEKRIRRACGSRRRRGED